MSWNMVCVPMLIRDQVIWCFIGLEKEGVFSNDDVSSGDYCLQAAEQFKMPVKCRLCKCICLKFAGWSRQETAISRSGVSRVEDSIEHVLGQWGLLLNLKTRMSLKRLGCSQGWYRMKAIQFMRPALIFICLTGKLEPSLNCS